MRKWIWDALCDVILKGTYSNLYLKDHLQELDEKDRNLATQIFYGTLQNYQRCLQTWKRFAKRKVSPRISVLLTFSVYQLLFLDKVPAYAVINEAVKLARGVSVSTSGFVNAILREVERNEPLKGNGAIEQLSIETSVPEWLIRLWIAQYGGARASQIARATTRTLPVTLRANPLKTNEEQMEQSHRYRLVKWPIYVAAQASVASDPFYKQGKISVQDTGSYTIASFVNARPDEVIADLCAAPGTKTMAMAERMQDQGRIDAFDLHAHRVRLIGQDARRLGIHIVHAKQADSTQVEPEIKYDAVLCDVPCSGYGVLARKPDMKLRLSTETMDELIPLQAKILENGSKMVKEGGRLIYSTCTLNKKENEKQVEKFLKNHPEFILDQEQTIFPEKGHDGFYMARLIQKTPGESLQDGSENNHQKQKAVEEA